MSQRPPSSFTQATALVLPTLIIDGHRETWPLRSKRFGAWLRQQYYERTWDTPSQPAERSPQCAILAVAERILHLRWTEPDFPFAIN